jgi:primosomal protein N' (replication factor Y) (superfamily II helicase)
MIPEVTPQSDLISVAVDAPMPGALTYFAHPEKIVFRGDLVQVPLGKRHVLGFVLNAHHKAAPIDSKSTAKEFVMKNIAEVITDWPRLTDPYLKWLEWVSDYYLHPIGRVLQLTLPPLKKEIKARKSNRPPVIDLAGLEKRTIPELTGEQKKCFTDISSTENFNVHLIRGVTGSGKTEVYLRLFEKCLRENKKGLFLLPEISLTPQLVQRFAERFGDQVAVIHSQLTDRERTNQWWDIAEHRKSILIGARSALFCPIENLGLIIVDEEHEASFKQDEKLKYNGRDSAIMLAQMMNCPIILGSATPSLESWNNAINGKYKLHQLNQRVHQQPLPEITVVDMRLEKENEKRPASLPSWLSLNLFNKIQVTLDEGFQVALLLNRRGLSNMVFCQSCGYSAECPNCDIHLTLHAKHHLVCHYCDYHQNFTLQCPDCKEGELIPLGIGTEKLEADLKSLFPKKAVARADRDEITNRAELENLISQMEKREIDILIGTQMIAKGLDFPFLNLVGLVLADVGFNLPDFRTTERSFQLMTQMSGRSGRNFKNTGHSGEVVIQTYNTEHDSLRFVINHDFISFAEFELQNRSALNYPPFHKIISLRINSTELATVKNVASTLAEKANFLKSKYPDQFGPIQILGPASAPLQKIKNVYRFHLLLKAPQSGILNTFASYLLKNQKWVPPKCKVMIDVDPMNLL